MLACATRRDSHRAPLAAHILAQASGLPTAKGLIHDASCKASAVLRPLIGPFFRCPPPRPRGPVASQAETAVVLLNNNLRPNFAYRPKFPLLVPDPSDPSDAHMIAPLLHAAPRIHHSAR